MKETAPQQAGRAQNLIEWAESIASAIALILLVFVFAVQPANVDGESMLPTLNDQDKVLLRSAFYTPAKGDIVVIDSYSNYKETLIKRVIATEGDRLDIDYSTGAVTVNGALLEEPYISAPTMLAGDMPMPLTVPENCVFVMGDNRPYSKDSRRSEVGFVDRRDVMGKAVFRIMPINSFGGIK